MPTEPRKCLNCGKDLSKQQIWRKRKYCSRKCSANGIWGAPTQFGKISTRSKAFVEAVKLCQSGFTKVDAAQILHIHPHTITDWFTQHNVTLSGRKCKHCGNPLDEHFRSNRKYCSKKCSADASYARKHPFTKQRPFDPELRANALELYWGGLEGTARAAWLPLRRSRILCRRNI